MKKIIITEKDLAKLVKSKLRMRDDREVVVSGVAIICDQDTQTTGKERLEIEYAF